MILDKSFWRMNQIANLPLSGHLMRSVNLSWHLLSLSFSLEETWKTLTLIPITYNLHEVLVHSLQENCELHGDFPRDFYENSQESLSWVWWKRRSVKKWKIPPWCIVFEKYGTFHVKTINRWKWLKERKSCEIKCVKMVKEMGYPMNYI